MYNSIAYISYLSFSVVIIVFVGKHLHRNGKVFLEESCLDKLLADKTNNLLYVGYCLVNIGFAFFQLNSLETLHSFVHVFEFVSTSIGTLLLTLGLMHYINMLFVPKLLKFFSIQSTINTNQLGKQTSTKTKRHEL